MILCNKPGNMPNNISTRSFLERKKSLLTITKINLTFTMQRYTANKRQSVSMRFFFLVNKYTSCLYINNNMVIIIISTNLKVFLYTEYTMIKLHNYIDNSFYFLMAKINKIHSDTFQNSIWVDKKKETDTNWNGFPRFGQK